MLEPPYGHVAFTGTQKGMTFAQKIRVEWLLRMFAERGLSQVLHFGDCIGADQQTADIATSFGYHLVAHPSTATHKVGNHFAHERYVAAPPLARNAQMLAMSEILIAAPETKQEIQRSGTWSTIRRARATHMEFYILYSDGNVWGSASQTALVEELRENISK
jgi:hypothetical protein